MTIQVSISKSSLVKVSTERLKVVYAPQGNRNIRNLNIFIFYFLIHISRTKLKNIRMLDIRRMKEDIKKVFDAYANF